MSAASHNHEPGLPLVRAPISIRAKLTALSLIATMLPVGVALAIVAARDIHDIHADMIESSTLIGHAVADYSAAALAFDDRAVAEKTLNGLNQRENVEAAALYNVSGRLYCSFLSPRAPASAKAFIQPMLASRPAAVAHLENDHIAILQPVEYAGTRYGTLALRTSIAPLRLRINNYLWVLGLLVFGALLASLVLAAALERVVSRPIMALAQVAKEIADRADYSVRAPNPGGDEIGLLADAFNSMLSEIGRRQAEAQRAIRVRDDFLSVASHELKTPLTALKLQVEGLLMASGQQPEPPWVVSIKNNLAVIARQVVRLDKLVANLLDVSRIAAGRLILEPKSLNLVAVAREVVANFQPELTRQHISLELVADDVVMGVWDPLRIEQIITNLVSNAIRYGAGNLIEIKVDSVGSDARLTVRDHGIGIAPHDLERVFERFERAVSVDYGGLGLGLYISRQIVRAHGGTISVESQLGQGSTFTVVLPCDHGWEQAGGRDGETERDGGR
jgi:signal transduction histidine kinase